MFGVGVIGLHINKFAYLRFSFTSLPCPHTGKFSIKIYLDLEIIFGLDHFDNASVDRKMSQFNLKKYCSDKLIFKSLANDIVFYTLVAITTINKM